MSVYITYSQSAMASPVTSRRGFPSLSIDTYHSQAAKFHFELNMYFNCSVITYITNISPRAELHRHDSLSQQVYMVIVWWDSCRSPVAFFTQIHGQSLDLMNHYGHNK